MSPEPHLVLGLGRMGNTDKDGKVGSFALMNHHDSLEIRCGEDSMWCRLCELQQRRNLNALGFCSFHGTFAAISGAIFNRDKQQHGRRQTAAA